MHIHVYLVYDTSYHTSDHTTGIYVKYTAMTSIPLSFRSRFFFFVHSRYSYGGESKSLQNSSPGTPTYIHTYIWVVAFEAAVAVRRGARGSGGAGAGGVRCEV